MTADGMFKKLGYKKIFDVKNIKSYKRENKFIQLSSGYDDGEIYIDVYCWGDGDKYPTWIDGSELKAISLKCKELEWIEWKREEFY